MANGSTCVLSARRMKSSCAGGLRGGGGGDELRLDLTEDIMRGACDQEALLSLAANFVSQGAEGNGGSVPVCVPGERVSSEG